MSKADVIIDLQYGSTGKGLLAGYLAHERQYDIAVSANMPNAGHTYITKEGIKFINKVLPSAATSPKVKKVFIGPNAVFSKEQLFKEIRDLEDAGIKIRNRLVIHPNAVVLSEEHIKSEASLSGIASTMQGSAAATVDKMMRTAGSMPVAASNKDLHPYLIYQEDWLEEMYRANKILVEGSQGYSLGINTQFYPYTTSRSCTPAAFMDYCGVPIRFLANVYGVARTFPIRVGNTENGTSGPVYGDQHELEWDELEQEAETTTVTGRIRRVFTFSNEQILDAMRECQPNAIFLNFANYMTREELKELIGTLIALGQQLDLSSQIVRWTGHGPTHNDVKKVKNGKLS